MKRSRHIRSPGVISVGPILLLTASCATGVSDGTDQASHRVLAAESLDKPPARIPLTEWPADWSALLGQIVTLDGTAADAKIGAILLGAREHVWIDGLDRWPDGYYSEAGNSKLLRATGRVVRRGDLPVFVPRPGELLRAGIPVDSEKEREKHRWRYLLEDATWMVIE